MTKQKACVWTICAATSILLSGCVGTLEVAEHQRGFARFISGVGQTCLIVDLVFKDSKGTILPAEIPVRRCDADGNNKDKSPYVARSENGARITYVPASSNTDNAGFHSSEQKSHCRLTGTTGNQLCPNMSSPVNFSICLADGWQTTLEQTGQAYEISPAKVNFTWNCEGLSETCQLLRNGQALSGNELVFSLKRHVDPIKTAFLSNGISLDKIQAWQTAGFSADTAGEWAKLGISPADAAEWLKRGWKIQSAQKWIAADATIKDAMVWRAAGFKAEEFTEWSRISRWPRIPVEEALAWKKNGFSPDQAENSINSGLSTPATAQKVNRLCPGGILPIGNLLTANPYDVQGKCYQFAAYTKQMLDRTHALMDTDGFISHIDFGKNSVPKFTRSIVRGKVPYTYVSIVGARQIVPSLEFILKVTQ